MLIDFVIGFSVIANAVIGFAIIMIVLLQRGEDGAFVRSTVHNTIRTDVNTLFSKTWKLILIFVLNIKILSLCVHYKYYDKSKYIQHDTVVIERKETEKTKSLSLGNKGTYLL